jgi:cytoplasmic iron level regulating protein YaaA (DUF328/UPF0246 family)
MLILLSPAKTLDFDTPATTATATQPALLEQSQILVDELQTLTPDKISALMHISEKLGNLNFERFMDWQRPFTKKNSKQALLAFKGDVYTGLKAEIFTPEHFKFAQQHLRILSGLYGVLRPLDLMQPYRLEMGVKFANPRGKDLYQFWGEAIAAELHKQLRRLKSDQVINLASNEYFKAVKSSLDAEVISPAFKDLKNGNYKIISFYAKKARGQMAAWIIQKGITNPAGLRKFSVDGYKYSADMSTPKIPVFLRDIPPIPAGASR